MTIPRSAGTTPRLGLTPADSEARHHRAPRPPAGAPNVVVIVLDDLGFGQLGAFGSDLATPEIDRLAAEGLRFNRFHVTALCSPTRASLLTGRNHHRVGMGFLPDIPMGFPGYTGRIPRSAAALPRLLRDRGYSTFAVGKWHLAPRWDQSASGPFDLWPLGLGFERFYGFLGGDANQWTPTLACDNRYVDPPARPEDGYHLTEDLAAQAIRMVQDQQQATPGKPFFLYFAPGAVHAPHQVPPQWISPYEGRFDGGWDRWRDTTFARQLDGGVVPAGTELPPRPSWVRAWDELEGRDQRLFARMQEVFAGFLTHTDAQVGKVLGFLDTMGLTDDTVVMVISDNGASAEGGPNGSLNEHRFGFGLPEDHEEVHAHIADLGGFEGYNHYAWGWAWAGNSPFRLWKRYTWLGGTRTPLVVRWPGGIPDPGAVRGQFAHVVDLMPTVLDLVGIEVPDRIDGHDQLSVDGASLRAVLEDPEAGAPRSTQYFEVLGSRAIHHEGWKAVTDHVPEGAIGERDLVEGSVDFATDRWSLFHVDDDFAEARDLADAEPEKLAELVARWSFEAGRNQVLPLSDGLVGRLPAMDPGPPPPTGPRTFRPGGGAVADDVSPPLAGGFDLVAHVAVGETGVEGIVCAQGDWINGWALYVDGDGRLTFVFNAYGAPHVIVADAPVHPGATRLACSYDRGRGPGGTIVLRVDGAEIGRGELATDLPFRWQIGGAGLRIGADAGFPVWHGYRTPFPFTAALEKVVIHGPTDRPAPDLAQVLHHE